MRIGLLMRRTVYNNTSKGIQRSIDLANPGDTIVIEAGHCDLKSTITVDKDGLSIIAEGAEFEFSGGGPAVSVKAQYVKLVGLKIKLKYGSSSEGTVGIGASTGNSVAHHISVRECYVEGFERGYVVRRTFYGGFYDCAALKCTERGFSIEDLAIANAFFNCHVEGAAVCKYGFYANGIPNEIAAGQTVFGGVFEGNTVSQICLQDHSDEFRFHSAHLEPFAEIKLTGTLAFDRSNLVKGNETKFIKELIAGQMIKLDVDGSEKQARIESISDDTNLVLSEPYAGTVGIGSASVQACHIHVNGCDTSVFYDMHYGVGGSPVYSAATYIESGDHNRVMQGRLASQVIVGAGANFTKIDAVDLPPTGIEDRGSYTELINHDPFLTMKRYIKGGANVGYSLDVGSSDTVIDSEKNISMSLAVGGKRTVTSDREKTKIGNALVVSSKDYADDASPSVAGVNAIYVNPSGPLTITDLSDGVPGQTVTILSTSGAGFITIRGEKIILSAKVAAPSNGFAITLMNQSGYWWEISRNR